MILTGMTEKLRFPLIIAVIIILNSCYPASLIETDVLNPAKKTFDSDIYRIGVVSRMDLDVKRTSGRIDDEAKNAFKRDSSMLKDAVLGLLDGLAESPRFEAYTIEHPRVLSGGQSALDRPFQWNLVDKLARKDTLDLVISLTAANFKDTVLRSAQKEGSQLEKKVYSSGYSEAYILFPHLYWRIYDLRNRDVSNFVQIDTLVYRAGPNQGYPARKTTVMYLSDAIGDAGYEYSRILAPYWTTLERVWYPTGDYYFNKASELANEGKWLEAIEIWRELANSDNSRVASRASLNMAVASEMLDKIDIAISWAEKSMELGSDYYPELYLKSLKYRKEQREILDKQMK